MRTTSLIWTIVGIIIVALAVWYLWGGNASLNGTGNLATTTTSTAGVNGSANQGNLGGTSSGQAQEPGGSDAGLGSTVGENLILGISTDTQLGTYLTAFNGMTVYTFKNDSVGTTTCYGQCATNWPPYTVPAVEDIHVPATITGAVSTVTRADGTLQVTYNGLPLYFWKNDNQPGDTTGQAVGNVWFVAKP